MIMNELTYLKNKVRFGLSRVNYPYVGYLFVKIYKF